MFSEEAASTKVPTTLITQNTTIATNTTTRTTTAISTTPKPEESAEEKEKHGSMTIFFVLSVLGKKCSNAKKD